LKFLGNSSWCFNKIFVRRRQVTLERKNAAEERRRLEEEKAKVVSTTRYMSSWKPDHCRRWDKEKLLDYGGRQAGAKRSMGEGIVCVPFHRGMVCITGSITGGMHSSRGSPEFLQRPTSVKLSLLDEWLI